MSLYHECLALRAQLLRIRGFQTYFEIVKAANDGLQPPEPVTHLWDLFSLGISLCYIFDLLPCSFPKINNSQFTQHRYEANPEKEKKRGIVLFAMQIRSKDVMERIPGLQPFTITDLLDRQTTNGLIKAVKSVSAIIKLLPESILEEASLPPPNDLSGLFPRNAVIPGPPEPSIISRSPKTLSDAQPGPFEEPLRMLHPDDSHDSVQDTSRIPPEPSTIPGPPENLPDPQPTRRALITREFVETERKFVNQLELMHTYSAELVRRNIVNRDSMHQMFPNLGNILGFQRRFLIRLETTFEQVWAEQRWGQHFIDCERQLIAVYEPYCLQSFSASELLESKMKDMAQLNALIDVRELNALHGCPITRVCRYALVLEDLVKAATADSSYPHLEALKQGAEASKRIFTKINDTMDRGNRQRTVKLLERRVVHWKGFQLGHFGEFRMGETLSVTKSIIEHRYFVCLFERAILCFKGVAPEPQSRTRAARNGVWESIVSKISPLLLEMAIFLSGVFEVMPQMRIRSGVLRNRWLFPLTVWYRGNQAGVGSVNLNFRSREQMEQWKIEIARLAREVGHH